MENSTTPPPPPPPAPPGPAPHEVPPAPGQTPADYYEGQSAPAQKKGCPKWIPIGCGAGGCLLLIILVAATFWAFRDGGGRFISGLLSPLQQEVVNQAAGDVTDEQKATFSREMEQLRSGLSAGSIQMVRVQPLIEEMRAVVEDRRVTSEEMDRLNELLLEINDGGSAPAPAPAGEGSVEL